MLRRLFLSALFCLFLSVTANADSFVITSGQVNVLKTSFSPNPLFSFSLLALGFQMGSAIDSTSSNVPTFRCPFYDRGACNPGVPINLSSTPGAFNGTDFVTGGFFRMNGVTYHVFGGSLTLTTSLVEIPFSDDLTVVMQTPFTLNFNMIAGDPLSPVFAQLTGGGIATLTLNRLGADQPYAFGGLNYTFQTPEPATLFLLVTGLGAVVYHLRRNRKRLTSRAGKSIVQ